MGDADVTYEDILDELDAICRPPDLTGWVKMEDMYRKARETNPDLLEITFRGRVRAKVEQGLIERHPQVKGYYRVRQSLAGRCTACGSYVFEARPGKYQCPKCE